MTEHRDIPRVGSPDDRPVGGETEGPPRSASRRLGRLVEAQAVRRLALSRIGRAGLAFAVLAALTVVGGRSISRWMVAWLHARPEHRVAFRDLRLDPSPPPWIKGGREVLLEQVGGGRASLGSFLDLDLDALLDDFRRNPWVARADRAVKDFPGRVTVSLRYREPVATVDLDGVRYVLDREGVVLPSRDLDLNKAGRLVDLVADNPPPPPKPGLSWPDEPDGRPGRVGRAARLAGFLKDRIRDEAVDLPQLTPDRVVANAEGSNAQGYWVRMADSQKMFVLWALPRSIDAPGEPADLDKWRWLTERIRGDGLALSRNKEYVDFDASGLRVRRFRNN